VHTSGRLSLCVAQSIAQPQIIAKFDIVISKCREVLNMAEAEPQTIDGEPAPEAKQEREAGRRREEKKRKD